MCQNIIPANIWLSRRYHPVIQFQISINLNETFQQTEGDVYHSSGWVSEHFQVHLTTMSWTVTSGACCAISFPLLSHLYHVRYSADIVPNTHQRALPGLDKALLWAWASASVSCWRGQTFISDDDVHAGKREMMTISLMTIFLCSRAVAHTHA